MQFAQEFGKLLSLAREIETDVEELEQLAALFPRDIRFLQNIAEADPYTADTMVRGIGQRLHQYYHTIERVIEKVLALTGELPDRDGEYHAQLLRKAVLELSGFRPAIIPKNVFDFVDELRKYRHAFRNLYKTSLKPDKILALLRDAQKAHPLIARNMLTVARFYYETAQDLVVHQPEPENESNEQTPPEDNDQKTRP